MKKCVYLPYQYIQYSILSSIYSSDTLSIIDRYLSLLFMCTAFLHEEHFLVDPLLDDDRFTSDPGSVSSLGRSVRVQEYTFL